MSIKADWKNNELLEEVKANRTADYPVHPLFLNRWSARSYLSKPVSDETLYTVLEAARWAPSSSNLQPWRFIVANTEEKLEQIRSFLFPNNRLWADQAPVLIVIASTRVKENGDPQPIHSFDTGAAWAALSLQASLLGLSTRYGRLRQGGGPQGTAGSRHLRAACGHCAGISGRKRDASRKLPRPGAA